MDAVRIADAALQTLKFIAAIPEKLDGAEKIAVLRSAAALLENVQAQETFTAAMTANIQNLLGKK